jgi:transcriptional regulator with XRE-family HTH domain
MPTIVPRERLYSGAQIRDLRARMGLTQREFARVLGLSDKIKSTISRWEHEHAIPDRRSERALADLFAGHPAPGTNGTSPSGIPYTVREDGSRSYAGYGGAFD